LATFILRTPRDVRNRVHNRGAIAKHMDSAELNPHGSDIANSTTLFFHQPHDMKHTLLKAVGKELTAFAGGAPQPTHDSREFEEVSSESEARTHTPDEEGTV